MSDHYYSKDALTAMGKFAELKGDLLGAFMNFNLKAFEEGALSAKTKELIAIGCAHITRCPYCIDGHTRKAKEAGRPENLIGILESKGSSYVQDLEWITKQRDAGAFIPMEDYRRKILGDKYGQFAFDDAFAVTMEISACQYFPFFMEQARQAIQKQELMPGRYIRVRAMKEQEEDLDLMAVQAAMKIIDASVCETLDTRGTDGSNIHLGGPETITGYFGGVGQPNDYFTGDYVWFSLKKERGYPFSERGKLGLINADTDLNYLLGFSAREGGPPELFIPGATRVHLINLLVEQLQPFAWLRKRLNRRRSAVRKLLPYALDLLTLSVEAGLDFTSALARLVPKLGDNPLAFELGEMLRAIRLGRSRSGSLRDLADRMAMTEVTSVTSSLIQADELGADLGPVLRVLSDQMRADRSNRAEKKAMEAPVKLLFPLIVFIFPTVFLILFSGIGIEYLKKLFFS